MPYFGYSRYPMKVRTRSIFRLTSSAFCSPSGRVRKRSSNSCSFAHASCRPCSNRRTPAPGSKFLMLPRSTGMSVVGRSLQRGLVMSISPTQRMPYMSRKPRIASRASRPPANAGSSSRKPSSSTDCRNATTSGCGRITSATPRSASPISDVTLWGTDCVSVSAAFFSPSHASSRSLSHQVASIADMNTAWLCRSNRIRQLLDVRQDEVEQRRSRLRPDLAFQGGDGFLVPCDQIGDDGRIGLDRGWRATCRRASGTRVRERWNEVAAFDDASQRIPDQWIGLPQDQEAGAARRRPQVPDDVDEQPAARLVHWPRRRHLPERETERFHGVGHHLLMPDGDVHVALLAVDRGDGEQRGDRPALDDLEFIIDQAPFDVLGVAEVRFDPPSQLRESHDLRIRQCWLLLPLRVDRFFLGPACRRGADGKLLGGDHRGDDLAVPHLVHVGVHQAGDQGLAEAEGGLHGGDLPV